MMDDTIGLAAGKVWDFLHSNGGASATKISQHCALDAKLTQRAIGWLAREGQIAVTLQGRNEIISLK